MTNLLEEGEPDNSKPLRCAIYGRTAENPRTDGNVMSVHEQREACQRFVGNMPNWEALPLTYLDVGFSGYDLDRPALQRLMLDVEAGRVDMVVVHDLDRLTRMPLDYCALMHRLKEADVGLAIVSDGSSRDELLPLHEKEPPPEDPS